MIRKMMRNLLGESYTEINGKLAIVNFGIILIMFIVSGIMLLFLPEQLSPSSTCAPIRSPMFSINTRRTPISRSASLRAPSLW